MTSGPPPTDDASFLWLYEQFKALSSRLERVEGKCEQLRSDNMRSTVLFPTRQEFQSLVDDVKQLAQQPKPKNR